MEQDVEQLARLLKGCLRRVDRDIAETRRVAAQLLDALETDTSREDTDDRNSREAKAELAV